MEEGVASKRLGGSFYPVGGFVFLNFRECLYWKHLWVLKWFGFFILVSHVCVVSLVFVYAEAKLG